MEAFWLRQIVAFHISEFEFINNLDLQITALPAIRALLQLQWRSWINIFPH
jgi:hypothetical protein